MKIRIVLYEEPGGGYAVEVPGLPGCYTEGETVEEALRNAREAIEGYLEAAAELAAQKIPRKPGETVQVLEIAV